MTRDFCDRCGEIIPSGKYKTGDNAHVPGPQKHPFVVNLKIDYFANNWKLCTYCANEVIDEAYKKMVEQRKDDGGNLFDKMRKAAE